MIPERILNQLADDTAAKLRGKLPALYVWNGSFQVFAGESALVALAVIREHNYRRAADGVYVKRGSEYHPGALRPMSADVVRI